jgi:hypothetical protein
MACTSSGLKVNSRLGLASTPENAATLTYAFDQLIKICRFHRNSCWTFMAEEVAARP